MLIFLGVGVDFPPHPPAPCTPHQSLGAPPRVPGVGAPTLSALRTHSPKHEAIREGSRSQGCCRCPPSNVPWDSHPGGWSSSGDPPVPCHATPRFPPKSTFLAAIHTLDWLLARSPNPELGGCVSDQPPRHSQAVTAPRKRSKNVIAQ